MGQRKLLGRNSSCAYHAVYQYIGSYLVLQIKQLSKMCFALHIISLFIVFLLAPLFALTLRTQEEPFGIGPKAHITKHPIPKLGKQGMFFLLLCFPNQFLSCDHFGINQWEKKCCRLWNTVARKTEKETGLAPSPSPAMNCKSFNRVSLGYYPLWVPLFHKTAFHLQSPVQCAGVV